MSNDYNIKLPFGNDYYEVNPPPQQITNKEEELKIENKLGNQQQYSNINWISDNKSTRRTTDKIIKKDDFNNTKNYINFNEESDFVNFNNIENENQLEANNSLMKINIKSFIEDYDKKFILKIQSLDNNINTICDNANKAESLSDAYGFLYKNSNLILQKQQQFFDRQKLIEDLEKMEEMKKLIYNNNEGNEDFSQCVNIKNNQDENKLKDKALPSQKDILPNVDNYEKKEKTFINNNNEKDLNNNIEEIKISLNKKRGRIPKELKEKGKKGVHDGNKEDNGLNKIFHKSLESFYDYSLKLMKQIDENIVILKSVINYNSIKNNTEKEKYLFKTIKYNICNFRPRRLNKENLEENKKKIERILNKDVIGKEKEKKILNLFLNMIYLEGLRMYIYDKPFILIKENGKDNKIDFSGLRTFKDDFSDYDSLTQQKFIKKAEELINGKSKKRKSRTKIKKEK